MTLDRSVFEHIFSDAHVVDVDFSAWDKSIDLYVLADHMPRVEGDRKPLFLVRLVGVRSFRFESAAERVTGLGPDEHVQWMIDDFRLDYGEEDVVVSLWGFETAPRIDVICRDVDVQPFQLHVFDQFFPSWDQPSQGLARPGPASLVTSVGLDKARNREENGEA